jgi:hypothetical protein
MELPADYLVNLVEVLAPFCEEEGMASLKDAERMTGKANRVAQVVPNARPFVSALYAALAASKADIATGKNRSRGRRIATRRFLTAAKWLRALIRGDSAVQMPLRRLVLADGPPKATMSDWVIQFDASTSGGGAVLRSGQRITEYFVARWTLDTARQLGAVPGESRYQTFWEFLTLLATLMVWGRNFKNETVAIVGDNTGTLEVSLSLKSKGSMAAVAREPAWRKERHGWNFDVGHIPSEKNTIPDALSRVHEKKPPACPHEALRTAVRRDPPDFENLWKTL